MLHAWWPDFQLSCCTPVARTKCQVRTITFGTLLHSCSVAGMYSKLSGHTHHYQRSVDVVDVVEGILDGKEARVMKCIFECNNIPVRMRQLLEPSLELVVGPSEPEKSEP